MKVRICTSSAGSRSRSRPRSSARGSVVAASTRGGEHRQRRLGQDPAADGQPARRQRQPERRRPAGRAPRTAAAARTPRTAPRPPARAPAGRGRTPATAPRPARAPGTRRRPPAPSGAHRRGRPRPARSRGRRRSLRCGSQPVHEASRPRRSRPTTAPTWPAAMSATARRRRAVALGAAVRTAAHEEDEAAARARVDQHADDAGQPAGEPAVADARDGVVGQRGAGGGAVLGGVEEARVCSATPRDRRGGRSRTSWRRRRCSSATAARRSRSRPVRRLTGRAPGDLPTGSPAPGGQRTRRAAGAAAPRTRSGRTARTAPSTATVIAASPSPMSDVDADHRGGHRAERRRRRPRRPRTAPTKASAATGTETGTRRPPAAATHRRGRVAAARPRRRRTRPSRRRTVDQPISVTLVPSAVSPPSAKSTAWTSRTTVMHSTAVHGPTRTAASAPPIRWPLVPAATGKLIICTAKTNAAVRPASGAVRSSSSRRAPRSATADGAGRHGAGGQRTWGRRGTRRGRARCLLGQPSGRTRV